MNKELWTLITVVFLGFLGISIPYLLFPALFLLQEYAIVPQEWSEGLRGIFLGMTLAAYPFGQFLGSPILGSLSDDYGRKGILSWSLAIAAFFSMLCAVAIMVHSVWLLIASRFFMGFMEGNIAIARAMAADMKEVNKQRTFGLINAAASVAYMLGPFIGALLVDGASFSASVPFVIVALLFFALAFACKYMLPTTQVDPQRRRSLLETIHLPRRLALLFQDRTLKYLFMVVTFFTLAADMFYQFGPIYLTEKWALTPSALTWYNGALCLALALGNGWAAGFSARSLGARNAIAIGMALLAIALVGLVLTPNNALLFCFFVLSGLGIAIGVTNLTIAISDSASEHIQGEVMGVQQSLRVFGDGAICIIGGLILSVSLSVVLLIAAVVSFLSLAYFMIKRTQQQDLEIF